MNTYLASQNMHFKTWESYFITTKSFTKKYNIRILNESRGVHRTPWLCWFVSGESLHAPAKTNSNLLNVSTVHFIDKPEM